MRRTLVGQHSGTSEPVPLNAWDQVIGPLYTRKAYFYRTTLDGDALQRSLDRVLLAYPTLAGRLVRGASARALVDASGQGASFEVVRGAQRFPWGESERPDKIDVGRYLPRASFRIANRDVPLLKVKLTHLKGGGSVLGVANAHCLMDGDASSRFMRDWARVHAGDEPSSVSDDRLCVERLADGHPIRPSLPELRVTSRARQALTVARLLGQIPTLRTRVWRLPRDLLDELRSRCQERSGAGPRISTNDALTAGLWRVLAPIRRSIGLHRLTMIVDARRRVDPPLPEGLFANACVGPARSYVASEIGCIPLPALAAQVRTLVDSVNSAYVRDVIGFMRAHVTGEVPRPLLMLSLVSLARGGLMFDSWARSSMYDLDFGGGTAAWMDLPHLPLPGLVLPMPDPRQDGSLVAHVSLPRTEWRRVDALAPMAHADQGRALLGALL